MFRNQSIINQDRIWSRYSNITFQALQMEECLRSLSHPKVATSVCCWITFCLLLEMCKLDQTLMKKMTGVILMLHWMEKKNSSIFTLISHRSKNEILKHSAFEHCVSDASGSSEVFHKILTSPHPADLPYLAGWQHRVNWL